MSDSKPKYHYKWDLRKRDPTIEEPTELLLEIGNPLQEDALLAGIDNSIVNGLRRIILSEIPVWGFRQNILIPETFIGSDGALEMGNLTVFSAQQIADRVGMVPVHGDESQFPDPENWVFRLCDPKNPNKPLRYEHLFGEGEDEDDLYNRMRYVKVKHIQVFHRKIPEVSVGASMGVEVLPLASEAGEPGAEASSEPGASASSSSSAGAGAEAEPEPKSPVPVAVSRELLNKASARINFINLDSGEWEQMDGKFLRNIFKYPELILAALKKGESLFAEMYLGLGTGGVINPNSMVPNAMTHARWISAISQYRMKKQKEAQEDYDYDEQVRNAKDNLDTYRDMQPALSKKKITEIEISKVGEYWNNLTGQNLFVSTRLKEQVVGLRAEDLSGDQLDEIRTLLEKEWNDLSGAEQKVWDEKACGFFIGDPEGLEREKKNIMNRLKKLEQDLEEANNEVLRFTAKLHPPEKTNDPIKDQQEYLLSKDPIMLRYDMPDRWFLRIIYNGHLWPEQIWIRAIETMIAKVESFQVDVLDKIQDFGGRISERASVNFSRDIPNKMEIIIDDKKRVESATLGHLIKSHFIFLLDHLIGENYPEEEYFTVMQNCFANWRVPHPLVPEMYLTFKTPEKEHLLFSDKDKFQDLFNDEKNEALRLLRIECHHILKRLNDLLEEAREMYQQNQG